MPALAFAFVADVTAAANAVKLFICIFKKAPPLFYMFMLKLNLTNYKEHWHSKIDSKLTYIQGR